MLRIFNKKNLHGYSIIKNAYNVALNLKIPEIRKIAQEYDSIGYMSAEVGQELDGLYTNDDYVIGIHRTGYTIMTENMISTFFSRGLINNGDAMQGATGYNANIEKTVDICDDLMLLVGCIKTCEGYKNSNGCIIVKIPKSYLGKKEGDIQPIYYLDGKKMLLLPEFIYGYIPVNNNRVERIIHNPNYRDRHSLINDNFYYDHNAEIEANLKNRALIKLRPFSLNMQYQVLYKAYKETYEKYGYNQALAALNSLINNNNISYFTGNDNKIYLERHIAFHDITKILMFGLNSDIKDINILINLFNKTVENSIFQKENTK